MISSGEAKGGNSILSVNTDNIAIIFVSVPEYILSWDDELS